MVGSRQLISCAQQLLMLRAKRGIQSRTKRTLFRSRSSSELAKILDRVRRGG